MGGKYITDGVYNSMIYVASLNYDVPELVGMTWDSDEALTEKEGTVTDKPDMSDIENGNITVNSNFYSETVIHKNEDKTDAVSDSIFDGTKENKATLHAISEDELKAIGIDMDNLSASVPE